MQTRTQSIGIRKAISIVENMNNIDSYKTLAEQREEALFNERLAMGAAFEKGKLEGILEAARNMLRKNYPLAEITEMTGLSASELNAL
jgi:predicted transposase/invertase (TIGR01784 family)